MQGIDTTPKVMWHATADLAIDFASRNPRYVAVESTDPADGFAWATVRSAPLLAGWLEAGRTRVLYIP